MHFLAVRGPIPQILLIGMVRKILIRFCSVISTSPRGLRCFDPTLARTLVGAMPRETVMPRSRSTVVCIAVPIWCMVMPCALSQPVRSANTSSME